MMNMVTGCHSALDTISNFFNKTLKAIILIFAFILLSACGGEKETFVVEYDYETPPIASEGDAADDPAIFLTEGDPLILGTDKTAGMYIYSFTGEELAYYDNGKPNNVDVRDSWFAYTDRSDNSVQYAKLFENISLAVYPEINIYGICIGIVDSELRAIVTEEEGINIQYWNLEKQELIKTIDITADEENVPAAGNEAEGCVFDEENGHIFISREGARGILKVFDTENLELIKQIDSRDGNIGGDPEGIAVYKTGAKDGFIILSSQGDNKFNMYDRQYPFDYQGSFQIKDVEHTDGLDVTAVSFERFPKGFLIVHDGENLPDNQNFKIVDMERILKKKVAPGWMY